MIINHILTFTQTHTKTIKNYNFLGLQFLVLTAQIRKDDMQQ